MTELINNISNTDRIDPLTGESFEPRSSKQYFACPANQIKYNNRKASKIRIEKMPYDKFLNENRKILSKILGNEKEIIRSEDFLLGAGFVFGCITNFRKIEGITVPCIYEFAFQKMENKKYLIFKV